MTVQAAEEMKDTRRAFYAPEPDFITVDSGER